VSDDSSGNRVSPIWIPFAFIIGFAFGEGCANGNWIATLVDNPNSIAAIRSRVIAERAEQVATK